MDANMSDWIPMEDDGAFRKEEFVETLTMETSLYRG